VEAGRAAADGPALSGGDPGFKAPVPGGAGVLFLQEVRGRYRKNAGADRILPLSGKLYLKVGLKEFLEKGRR
jgi:hypothetical protein